LREQDKKVLNSQKVIQVTGSKNIAEGYFAESELFEKLFKSGSSFSLIDNSNDLSDLTLHTQMLDENDDMIMSGSLQQQILLKKRKIMKNLKKIDK
jgi:hypothetical protein